MDSGCYTDGSGVGFYPTKINSALTSAFPKAIDIDSDITKQGLVDTYLRELKSALRTRGLMDIIEQREPILEEVISANRGTHTRTRHTHMNENKSKTPHTRDTHTHHDDTTGPEVGDCMLVTHSSVVT